MADRTEIEWIVQPPDFFESQYQYQTDEYTVVIDKRRVLVTSFTEKNPLSDSFLDRLSNEIESIFNTRQLQVHKKYTLEGPRICKYHNNHKNAIIHVENSVLHLSAPPIDILIQDSAGRMIHDTKSERIAIDKQMLDLIIPNVPRSIELQNMLRSYNSAVNDPFNELVYYYEIREILNTLGKQIKLAPL